MSSSDQTPEGLGRAPVFSETRPLPWKPEIVEVIYGLLYRDDLGIGALVAALQGLEEREGPVGPGRALQQALGSDATVVATIIAGDNFIVEETETAMEDVRDILQRHKPDVVIAGPAFEAGRYGLACAEVCRQSQAQGIPAVTGMSE